MTDDTKTRAVELTATWLANPNSRITPHEVSRVLSSIHSALRALGEAGGVVTNTPFIAVKRAVSPAASLKIVGRIISMIDGRPYTSLTRHLKAHGLTAAAYRERYGLRPDYPIVAPAYSEARRDMARRIWGDRKRLQKASGPS